MLQHLRDNSRGIISFILIGALVIMFALAGVERLFNWDPTADRAASVNGESISKSDLARAIARQKQEMMSRYGDQVPADFLTDEYLTKPVLQNLIRRQVLSQAAKAGGMAIGDAAISAQITSTFKKKDGTFDGDLYTQALARMGYSHSSFAKQLSGDMVLNQLHMGMAASAFSTADEFNELVSLSYQTRDFDYIVLPSEKVKAGIVISDEEVAAEYKGNPSAYTAQDEIAVDYIDLNVADFMKDVSVTEEQVRKQYQQAVSSFVAQPEREVAHILVDSSEADKIKQVSDRLASGADFAAVAKELSEDEGSKNQGGNLGYTKGDTFPPEFEKALAALKVGEVSAPVKTSAGTHFIKLLSERGEKAPSFEEQKATIEDQLKRAEAENIFVAKLDELKDKAFSADNLGEVAKEMNLTVKNSGLFSRAGGAGILANKQIVDAAFSDTVLKDGDSSEPIELDASRVVVIKKTDYQPSHLRPLDEVKDAIIASLTGQRARQLINDLGLSYIAKLRDGVTIADLAKEQSIDVNSVAAATRSGAGRDPEIIRFAFGLGKPQAGASVVDGFVNAKGDFAVVSLHSVTPGTLAAIKSPEQQSAMRAQVAAIIGEGEYSSYETLLKDGAEIK